MGFLVPFFVRDSWGFLSVVQDVISAKAPTVESNEPRGTEHEARHPLREFEELFDVIDGVHDCIVLGKAGVQQEESALAEEVVLGVLIAGLDSCSQGNDELGLRIPALVQQHPVGLFHDQGSVSPFIMDQISLLLCNEELEAVCFQECLHFDKVVALLV